MKPPDFEEYWAAVLGELEGLPPAVEAAEIPLRSTEDAVCFGLRFTSVGPYRLFGYLSVPRAAGPFPALFFAPGYQSVVEVLPQGQAREKRARYVTFSMAARGQRNADRPYIAEFPGLLTDGILDPREYIFRGIVADTVRGLEVLLSRPEVDRNRVAVLGTSDVAFLAAALRPVARLLVTECDLFYRAREIAPLSPDYPLEEINDFLRARPEQRGALFSTLDYFDPLHFAPRVKAECLLWAAPDGGLHDAAAHAPLARAVGGRVESRPRSGSRYLDGRDQEEWLTRRLGFAKAILPAAWK